jgi:hypothetical protein
MLALTASLAAGLALALTTVLYLAIVLPQRVMRLLLEERLAEENRARAENLAFKQTAAIEVQTLVYALRSYHDEIAQRASIAKEITTEAAAEEVTRLVSPLRGLIEWALVVIGEPFADAVETTPRPSHMPASRDRPLTRAPAIAPPGSASGLPSWPALIAAGLGPRPGPPAHGMQEHRRTSAIVGLAPPARDLGDSVEWIGPIAPADTPVDVRSEDTNRPDDAPRPVPPGPWRSLASAPTLVSMVTAIEPSPRAASTVDRGAREH